MEPASNGAGVVTKDAGRDLLDVGWKDEPVGITYLLGAMRRQFLVMLVVPLVCLVLGLAYVILAEPLYTATASIRVQVDDPAPTGTTSPLDTHVELIRSNWITSSVIEELRLHEVLDATPGRLTRVIAQAREWLDLEVGEAWSDVDEQSLMIGQVQAGLTVRRIGDTSIIAVQFTSPRRSRSVEVANAFATTYVRDVSDAATRSIERRTDLLQGRADEVRGLASSADEAARRLLSQNDFMIASAEDLEDRIAELRQQLSTINADEAELRVRQSLNSQAGNVDALEAVALQTSETLAIYTDMMAASSTLAELQRQPGVSEDTIAPLEESIAGMRASLELAARRIHSELQLELELIAARRSSILTELNETLDYGRSTEWSDLLEAQRKAEVYEGIYQAYLNDLEALNSAGTDADIELVSEARPPVDPSFPDPKVLLALAGTIGIVVGVGFATHREWARSHAHAQALRAGRGGRQPL